MDEDIIIPIIVFSFILSLVWMILNHFRWRQKQKLEATKASGNSLRTSELKDIMREAVVEATMPLADRIDALEAQLRRSDTPRLMPAQRDELLEELRQSPEEIAEPAKRRGVT